MHEQKAMYSLEFKTQDYVFSFFIHILMLIVGKGSVVTLRSRELNVLFYSISVAVVHIIKLELVNRIVFPVSTGLLHNIFSLI